MSSPRFVIVGGGASGTLVAVQLLRQAKRPVEVVLAEPGRIGRGVAYGTPHREHLLNVPSGRMSALPDEADHFVRWLAIAGEPPDPGGFASRRVYGAYLRSTLTGAASSAATGVRFHEIREDVVAIGPHARWPTVVLRSGRTLEADRVAIAVGNLAGPGPLPALHGHPRYVGDPWAVGALEPIPPSDPVLVLGTGLTMVDAVLVLSARSHAAPILAVSRHGLLPLSHAVGAIPPVFRPPSSAPSLRGWVRWARGQGGSNGDWRDVIDVLRPVTQEAWTRLGDADRRRFLRHLRPYWDVHRHRMPPSVAEAVAELLRTGRLEVQALLESEGRPSSALFTLGPLLRGRLWETTAVPEIRKQAQALATTWLAGQE